MNLWTGQEDENLSAVVPPKQYQAEEVVAWYQPWLQEVQRQKMRRINCWGSLKWMLLHRPWGWHLRLHLWRPHSHCLPGLWSLFGISTFLITPMRSTVLMCKEIFSIGLKRQYTCTRRNLSSRTTSLSTSTPVASLCLLKSSTTGPHCHWSGKQLGIVCLSSGCTLTQKIESNRHNDSKILQTEEDISQDLPVLEVQSSRVCWLVQYLSWPRSGKPQVKNSRNSGQAPPIRSSTMWQSRWEIGDSSGRHICMVWYGMVLYCKCNAMQCNVM